MYIFKEGDGRMEEVKNAIREKVYFYVFFILASFLFSMYGIFMEEYFIFTISIIVFLFLIVRLIINLIGFKNVNHGINNNLFISYSYNLFDLREKLFEKKKRILAKSRKVLMFTLLGISIVLPFMILFGAINLNLLFTLVIPGYIVAIYVILLIIYIVYKEFTRINSDNYLIKIGLVCLTKYGLYCRGHFHLVNKMNLKIFYQSGERTEYALKFFRLTICKWDYELISSFDVAMFHKFKYRYAASSCLCGINCRYDGGSNLHKKVYEDFEAGLVLPICPEVLGGLTVPRTPCEIVGAEVISKDMKLKTAEYKAGAEKALELIRAHQIKFVVLKEKSPSCGVNNIYDGSFTNRVINGVGITSRLFLKNNIKIVSSDEFKSGDNL